MSWLTDDEITKKIKRNAPMPIQNMFGGIFPIDMLPPIIHHRPIFLVINAHTKNLPGEHWKAIFIKENKTAEVFDSLALQLNVHTENWLNKYTKRWVLNPRAYQHPLSASCGSFVLYYILNRLKYPTFNAFLKSFTSSVINNEQMVRKFYDLLL